MIKIIQNDGVYFWIPKVKITYNSKSCVIDAKSEKAWLHNATIVFNLFCLFHYWK